jgi:hypothetical protein
MLDYNFCGRDVARVINGGQMIGKVTTVTMLKSAHTVKRKRERNHFIGGGNRFYATNVKTQMIEDGKC